MSAEELNAKRLPDLERALTAPGWKVRSYEQSGSTMELARELAQLIDQDEIGFVLSLNQNAGRGRHGRVWEPPRIGFYGTFVTRAAQPMNRLLGSSLAVGCGLISVCSELGVEAKLKWPNDLLLPDGRKIGGVLIELLSKEDGIAVLTGIGVNLAGEPSQVENVASLHTAGAPEIPPQDFAPILQRAFLEVWDRFKNEGFAPFRNSWLEHAIGVGQEVTIEHGGDLIVGIFAGVSADGALEIVTPKGKASYTSAEVKNLRPLGGTI